MHRNDPFVEFGEKYSYDTVVLLNGNNPNGVYNENLWSWYTKSKPRMRIDLSNAETFVPNREGNLAQPGQHDIAPVPLSAAEVKDLNDGYEIMYRYFSRP